MKVKNKQMMEKCWLADWLTGTVCLWNPIIVTRARELITVGDRPFTKAQVCCVINKEEAKQKIQISAIACFDKAFFNLFAALLRESTYLFALLLHIWGH